MVKCLLPNKHVMEGPLLFLPKIYSKHGAALWLENWVCHWNQLAVTEVTLNNQTVDDNMDNC